MKYLVNFSDKTGKSGEEVSFAPGADLYAVADWLKAEYSIEVPSKKVMTLLNGHGWNQYSEKLKKKLENGDVVILMPPISGG